MGVEMLTTPESLLTLAGRTTKAEQFFQTE